MLAPEEASSSSWEESRPSRLLDLTAMCRWMKEEPGGPPVPNPQRAQGLARRSFTSPKPCSVPTLPGLSPGAKTTMCCCHLSPTSSHQDLS